MKKKEKHKKIAKKLAKEKVPMFDISQETKNSIFGVLSIIFAVLSTLSFFGRAGAAGEIFNSLSKSLFGWGFFIVPFAFVLLATAFIRSISRKIYLSAVIGTLLFTLSILAAFFIFGEVNFKGKGNQGGLSGIVF